MSYLGVGEYVISHDVWKVNAADNCLWLYDIDIAVVVGQTLRMRMLRIQWNNVGMTITVSTGNIVHAPVCIVVTGIG